MRLGVAQQLGWSAALWFAALGCRGTLTTEGGGGDDGVDARAGDASPLLIDAAPADASSDYASLTAAEQSLFDIINEERVARSMGKVELRSDLICAAARHSLDIGEQGICAHTGSDGSSPGDRVADCQGPGWSGEIVACGQSTPRSAVDAWIGSSGHAAIMFDSGQIYVGVAMHQNYWTAIFDQ